MNSATSRGRIIAGSASTRNDEAPKAADADARLLQRLDLREQKIGLARQELERDGEEQLLRGRVLQRHALEHLLEEHALVRGVLVDEHETLRTFRDDVEIRHAAEHAQAEAVGDERFRTARGRPRCGNLKRSNWPESCRRRSMTAGINGSSFGSAELASPFGARAVSPDLTSASGAGSGGSF